MARPQEGAKIELYTRNRELNMRLQVVLARSGVASRRKAADVIGKGRVTVNGRVVRERGFAVDPDSDTVTVDGKRLIFKKNKTYIMLNKPKGVITSKYDPEGRKTIFQLLPGKFASLHPIGRLDKDTTGLLLITDDGDLTYRLTHPKFEVRKTYRVGCKGRLGAKEIKRLERGMMIEGRKTARAKVEVVRADEDSSELYLDIHEGRKRQIRNMFLFLGHPIKKLERVRYEFLDMKGLRSGGFRHLTRAEIRRLKDM